MNSTLENSLQEILQCAICHETIKGAVILNCGHAFCSQCLDRYLNCGNSCPLCREPLTERSVRSGLIVNKISAALSDHMKPGSSKQRLMCHKHPHLERKYACERCRKLVCSECIIGDHFHKSLIQRPKDIAEIQDEMSLLVDRSEKWISDKKAYDNKISNVKRKVESVVSTMMDNLSQIDETLDMLEATVGTAKRLKEKLTSTTLDKKQCLIKHKEFLETKQKEITKQTKQISSHQSRMKEALQAKRPDDIINVHVVYSQKLKDILSCPMPSLMETETKDNDAAVSLPPAFNKFKMCCKIVNHLSASLSNAKDAEEEIDDSGEDDTEENEDNSDNDGENSDDRGEDPTNNYDYDSSDVSEENDDSDEDDKEFNIPRIYKKLFESVPKCIKEDLDMSLL